jgi:hypothetical protein
MTDSLTSEGWLLKLNFIEDGEDPIQATIRIEVGCYHASQYPSNRIQEYSQWFPGAMNNVVDTLYQDDDWSNKELTQLLCSLYPSQLSQHFKIVPLPNKISSWLTLLLLQLPVKQQLVEAHSRMKLGHGEQPRKQLLPSD